MTTFTIPFIERLYFSISSSYGPVLLTISGTPNLIIFIGFSWERNSLTALPNPPTTLWSSIVKIISVSLEI